MNLQRVKDVFRSVLPDETYHYEADTESSRYIVWAEDGQSGSLHADNVMNEQVISGTTDFFTKDEYDPLFDQIQQAMNSAKLPWRLESIQYEEDTKYIHYEWSWEVVNHIGQTGN